MYVTHPETQKKQVLPAGARGHGLADEEVAEITGGGGGDHRKQREGVRDIRAYGLNTPTSHSTTMQQQQKKDAAELQLQQQNNSRNAATASSSGEQQLQRENDVLELQLQVQTAPTEAARPLIHNLMKLRPDTSSDPHKVSQWLRNTANDSMGALKGSQAREAVAGREGVVHKQMNLFGGGEEEELTAPPSNERSFDVMEEGSC